MRMTSSSGAGGESTPARTISLLLSDVDGTLVTTDKRLTSASIDAVGRLREHDIAFAITSSRPPRGLLSLAEALNLTTPLVGFNSGMIMDRSGRVLRQNVIDAPTVRRALEMLGSAGVDIWLFSGNDWLLRDPDGVYVDLERRTIGYGPIVADFEPAIATATKIVGVSADFPRLAQCETAMRQALGPAASVALSQHYYLDVTHPAANKGSAVLALAELLRLPASAIATIGDMPNDVPMFEKSGFSIAMGNAADAVKARASAVTDTNERDGFAKAVERFILRSA
jgi:Cof subfamily protein (haloacid dehalogenase superfamily)